VASYLVLVLPFARGIGFRALLEESGLPVLSTLGKALARNSTRETP
jgi:hypothetical protein